MTNMPDGGQMVFPFGTFLLVEKTDSRIFKSGNGSSKPNSSSQVRRPALGHTPCVLTFTRLTRFRIKPGISNEFWNRRKLFNVTANLGEDDGGKSFANARNRFEFRVKVVHKSSNLFVESGDGRFKRLQLLQILTDYEREARRGKHDAKRIFSSLLNLVGFVETEATARSFIQKVGESLSIKQEVRRKTCRRYRKKVSRIREKFGRAKR